MTNKTRLITLAAILCVALAAIGARKVWVRFHQTVMLPDGVVAAQSSAVVGFAESARQDGRNIVLSGWAIDVHSFRPAQLVVGFVDGQRWSQSYPAVARPDVVRAYVAANLLHSGYTMDIPVAAFAQAGPGAVVRVFAEDSGGWWKELGYRRGFPYASRMSDARWDTLLFRDVKALRASARQLGDRVDSLERTDPAREASSAVLPIYITPRDDYPILDRGQDSFNDEDGKEQIACSAIPHSDRTAVILTFGQSNAANMAPELFTPAAHVYNLNLFTGHCVKASDPLLGTTGRGANFATRLGDMLVKSGLFSDVVLVPIAVGASFMEDWAPGGIHHRRLDVAIKRAHDAGFAFTFLLWHQGEANVQLESNPRAYRENFLEMLASIRARGVNAPVFVPLVSVCGSPADPNVRSAQAGLVNAKLGIFPGPDSDTIGVAQRFDGCHISGSGLDEHAKMWLLTLERFVKEGPSAAVTGARVTAATLGMGPSAPPLSPPFSFAEEPDQG